jgi:hypothetical protein
MLFKTAWALYYQNTKNLPPIILSLTMKLFRARKINKNDTVIFLAEHSFYIYNNVV